MKVMHSSENESDTISGSKTEKEIYTKECVGEGIDDG